MKLERFEFTGQGGMKLPACIWLPEGEAKAVLQIAHGMTEHIGRYASFASALTDKGVIVAGFDLRGHGENVGSKEVASFGEGGWDKALCDMNLFSGFLRGKYASLPHYMLGFSLGSFLLREYLSKWSDGISGAVIMGTGSQPGWLLSVMKAIVKREIGKSGFDNTTDLVRNLSFGAYNQTFKPNRTSSDWLIGDEKALDEYLSDPLCRKDISSGLFFDLLSAMQRTGKKDTYKTWNKSLPVLLLSGSDDPVGSRGKGVLNVKKQMEKGGVKNIYMRLIPDARHIVLAEEASGAKDAAIKAVTEFIGI